MNMNKQISNALTAHKKWKERLEHAIHTGKTEFQPEVVRTDDQCEFGRWLYSDISEDLKQTPVYKTVIQLHADFHMETARILEMRLKGHRDEAEKAMRTGGAWSNLSFELNSKLLSWEGDDSTVQKSSLRQVSADKVKTVLAQRAHMLLNSTEVQTGETMQVVVFSLANETYGIGTEFAKEVQPLRDVTPVPCTPDFCVGVINIRGSIYPVIDIRGFFGVAKKEITDSTKVILVEAGGLEVGILADDVSGAASVPIAEIKPPLAAQSASKEEYILGVTKKMLIILNLEALLRDDRIIVRQEVG